MDTETAYENLANAIVLQAVKDYRNAKMCGNGSLIGSLRKFFRSDWFKALTDIDGEWLIRQLDKEAKHDNKGVIATVSLEQGDRARPETATGT